MRSAWFSFKSTCTTLREKKVAKSFDHEMPEEKAGTPGLENIFTFKFCS